MSNNSFTTNHRYLGMSATLLLMGILISLVAGTYHPDHALANDHTAAFLEYASDATWTATHLGQFAGMVFLIAGLIVLYFALDLPSEGAGWAGRFGVMAAVIALGLYGVLQAVDGVALKQAVDAWAGAPEAEKAIRFASAEAIRWLEWAVRSYQSFMLGLTFILFAAAIVWTARVPRPIGYLMGISGLAYLAQGWILGTAGFSETNGVPTLLGILSVIGWSIWLLYFAWRTRESTRSPSGQPGFAHA